MHNINVKYSQTQIMALPTPPNTIPYIPSPPYWTQQGQKQHQVLPGNASFAGFASLLDLNLAPLDVKSSPILGVPDLP